MFPSLPSRLAAVRPRARAAISSGALLSGALVATILAISACSTSNVLSLRPDVDVGTQTAAVSGGGMQDLVPDDPYLSAAEQAPDGGQQSDMMQSADGYPVETAQPAEAAEPVEMAQAAGMAQSLGAEPAEAAPVDAEPFEAAPVDAEPVEVAPAEAAPVDAEPVEAPQPIETVDPAPILAAYPRIDNPMSRPRSAMPADQVACRRELKRLGVVYSELPRINDGGSCQIDYPIKVTGLPGRIAMKPAATLNCEMAATFARWTRKELSPAARLRYFSSVKAIHQASSYSCRRINGSRSMSEHSKGNALDVSRIELKNGRDIDVRKPGLFAFRTRGFLNNVRTDGCEYFTTVLGPGYNRDHRDHFHFDIKPRRNGRHACH